jgi:hypothetical protein
VALSIAAAVVAALAGCSSGSGDSCAYVVVFEGRTYQWVAASGVQTGVELGTGVTPGCDDGQPVPAETLSDPLVEVVGLDPTEAVALVHGDGQVDLMVRSNTTATRSSEVEAYLADHPPAEASQ